MKAYELSHKYALAVFSEALEGWFAALNAVHSGLANEPELLERLQDTARSFQEKQKELDKLIPDGTDKEIRNFLYILLREDDIGLLGQIVSELERMSRGGSQVQVARVTTAIPLTAEHMEQFRQKLRAKYGQNLEFAFNVDPHIVGGVVVQIGDTIIDGSVANRLEAMSNALGIKR